MGPGSTPSYPRFSLRTEFPVRWGKPLSGSRCFSESGNTPRVWAGACKSPRQGFSARGDEGSRCMGSVWKRMRSGRTQLYTGTLVSSLLSNSFSRNKTILTVTKAVYFNFCRGFINPELFGTSGFPRRGWERASGASRSGAMIAGFIPSQASTAPGGGWLCAGLSRGIRRARRKTGLLVHIYLYISIGATQRQKMTGVPAGELGIPGLSSGAVCLFLRV